jgi:hypothetical protein
MATPFYLIWKEGQVVVHDLDNPGASRFGINFPGRVTKAKLVSVSSSGLANDELRTLTNVKLYLDGEDSAIVQLDWPTRGGVNRPDLSGGLEISFDGGQTYTRFSATKGLKGDSSTWIDLPAIAIGLQGTDNQLGPFDTAQMYLRMILPPDADTKPYDVYLEADFDII